VLRALAIGFLLALTPGCLGGEDPNAPALAPDFEVRATPFDLPGKCGPEEVEPRVVDAAEAFNKGSAGSFSAAFMENGQLAPYSVGGLGFVGHEAIEEFVSERHHAGDGWTLTALDPPTGSVGLPREAAYGVDLIVQGNGFRREEGAKIVVDCASGLIAAWVGPAFGPPST
jgi:hypothetical protein